MRRFSEEEIRFIRDHYQEVDAKLTELFNRQFEKRTVTSIKSKRKAMGLMKDKFHIKKGERKSPRTEFIKGRRPINFSSVGKVTLKGDGYMWIKFEITKPSRHGWKQLHRFNWEKENGKIPEGHKIIFLDGDRTNCDVSNLMLVTSAELAVMNKFNLFKGDRELTRTGVALVKVIMRMSQVEKKIEARS